MKISARNVLKGTVKQVTPGAVKTSDIRIKFFIAENSKEEAIYVADQVLNYVGDVDAMSTGHARSDYNYAFSDIAVLCRTHHVADEIARQLKLKGIPVLLSDGTSFFSEPPFDRIANAMQLLHNPQNVIALSDLAGKLLGYNTEGKQILLKRIIENEVDLENVSRHGDWKRWIAFYNQLYPEFGKNNLVDMFQQLLEFFLPESTLTIQQQIKKEMLMKLAAESGDRPHDFLQKYILSPYTDAGRLNSGGVRLLTFHAAKGLEFPVVFIAGAEEGISPLNRKDVDIEEERRLFYVAMTRAKDELQIIRSRKRRQYGQEKEMLPSRFLSEFDQEYLQHVDFNFFRKSKQEEQQLKLF